jgi:hypothetical protein
MGDKNQQHDFLRREVKLSAPFRHIYSMLKILFKYEQRHFERPNS